MADLYLLFNHRLDKVQAEQAGTELGIQNIIAPPEEVSACWSSVPPEAAAIRGFLEPVFIWIDRCLSPHDYLLVQGEPGACWLVLQHISGRGIIAVYATTSREAVEQRLDDNSTHLTHIFRLVRFREYGQ